MVNGVYRDMSLRERYKKLKKMYPNSVFIKSGSFYNTYYEYVLIHEIFGYKLINKRVELPRYIINKMVILDSYVVADNFNLRFRDNYLL